jgi:dipeptidase E
MAGDRRRIVAMGGGGFGSRPGDPALDRYVLDVAAAAEPRICLLPTASGDPEEQIARFYRAYRDLPCEPAHVSLFRLGSEPIDLERLLLRQDVIYVGGGSLLNLVAIWRAHGLHATLRTAWERGTVLCGISAGSMCWFEAGVTKSHGSPRAAPGLGFLGGSNSVHWHSEPERRPVYRDAVARGQLPPGYGVDDGVGLLFAGTELAETVSARPGAGAWRVEAASDGAGATETPLEVTRLEQPAAGAHAGEPLSLAEFRQARRPGPGPGNRPARRAAGLGD